MSNLTQVLNAIYNLSESHAHGWTRYIDRDEWVPRVIASHKQHGCLVADPESLVDRAMVADEVGRSLPAGLRPELYHTTAAGRLSWWPAGDSRLTIEARRKTKLGHMTVLRAKLVWMSADRAPDWTVEVDDTPAGAESRHVLALETAIYAAQGQDLTRIDAIKSAIGSLELDSIYGEPSQWRADMIEILESEVVIERQRLGCLDF